MKARKARRFAPRDPTRNGAAFQSGASHSLQPRWRATLAAVALCGVTVLRLEAYAVTNSPHWGAPNASFGSTSFCQITSASGARQLQIAAKFYF